MGIIETTLICIGGIATLGIICFFVYMRSMTYNKDQQEQDERILVLEKRIQEQYKCFKGIINDFKDEIINLTIEKSDLEKRIQKLERKKKSDKE